MINIAYNDIESYMDWCNLKFKLKYDQSYHNKKFPILYNCIYWVHLGNNIGSEECKHRPAIITRTYKNSSLCVVIPLTTQRLNDSKHYHVDLESIESTALCEQMRVIDISRIDTPFYKNGKIIKITQKDWDNIDREIKIQYSLSKL